MKPLGMFVLLLAIALFHPSFNPAAGAANPPDVSWSPESSDQTAATSQAEHEVTIPGPLRSFLRMAGISQEISNPEVLPTLAHNLVLLGYQRGKATEFLILLRRYVSQAKELTTLAGAEGNIKVSGCKDAQQLLRVLGYRTQGDCGRTGMSLVTADAERAFVAVDSGFP
ncbi:MAG: hypothetical protein WB607_17280, partial [Candidatus Acidiferrum sp.]